MEINAVWFALGASFLMSVLIGPLAIPLLRRMKFGQQIRLDGPSAHLKKEGTPTMGGLVILLALLLAYLRFFSPSIEAAVLLTAILGYGLIGFMDDYLKILLKRSLGLTARQKLAGQLIVAGTVCAMLWYAGHSLSLAVPLTGWEISLGPLYYLLVIVMLLGTSNAVNFTDGLDGLLAGSTAITAGAFLLIAMSLGAGEIAYFTAALIGAVLGFLVFNAHPAKMFMGDTGSMAIGGGLAAIAILTKTELLLIVLGLVFVIEMLSVIIQVISFKTRGKRIFRMSPLHHHYELGGWSEWKIVLVFWGAGLIAAAIGLWMYGIL